MSELGQFRDPLLDVSGERVGFYPREFYPLDNFAAFQVFYQGRWWPTSEHLYQASHFFDTAPDIAQLIHDARSPHDAYVIANAHADQEPPDWDDTKIAKMEYICQLKLRQHQYVQHKLLQTGTLPIVEDSPKDNFWGWGPDRNGRNELGKLWMRLRYHLQTGSLDLSGPEPPDILQGAA